MEPKWFLKSKTIWGVVISILPALLPVLGLSFSADDTVLISNSGDAIIQAIGAVIAIYGRFVATGPATITP